MPPRQPIWGVPWYVPLGSYGARCPRILQTTCILQTHVSPTMHHRYSTSMLCFNLLYGGFPDISHSTYCDLVSLSATRGTKTGICTAGPATKPRAPHGDTRPQRGLRQGLLQDLAAFATMGAISSSSSTDSSNHINIFSSSASSTRSSSINNKCNCCSCTRSNLYVGRYGCCCCCLLL